MDKEKRVTETVS